MEGYCWFGMTRSCLEGREKAILRTGECRIGHVVKVVKLNEVLAYLDDVRS
jgi:hypothetical protein